MATNAAIIADNWAEDLDFGAGVYVGSEFSYTHTLAGFSLHRHDDLQQLLVIDPVHETAEAGWPLRKE